MSVDVCDRDTWETLGRQVDPGFYGHPEWLDVACRALGAEPRYLAVLARDAPVVRVALVARRRLGRTFLLTVPFAPYAGWAELFPADLEPERRELRRGEALDELARWCEAHASFTRIVLPPEVEDVRPFIWRGWRTELRYTYRIALAGDGSLALRTNARRNLERAREMGLAVQRPNPQDALRGLDLTIKATYARRSEPLPIRPERWPSYLGDLVALPSVRTVTVTQDDRPLAAVMLGFDAMRSYELHAGTTDEGTRTGASVLAMETAIRESIDRVPEFDFAGANIPSIAHFKRGFGGKLVPYVAVSWAGSWSARWLAERAPAVAKRLRGAVRR